jgi:hypothetical protein
LAASSIDVNVVTDVTPANLARLAAVADGLERTLWLTPSSARNEPEQGIREALAGLPQYGRLVTIPVLAPPTGSPDGLDRALELSEGEGAHVARLCPTFHGYPLVDWVLSPLPELCERFRFALMLDFAPAPIPWADLVTFARCYPSVPMVALDCDVRSERAAPAALDAALNLILHAPMSDDSVRLLELVSVFGAERFVGGSSTGAEPSLAEAGSSEGALAAKLSVTAASLADGSYAGIHF